MIMTPYSPGPGTGKVTWQPTAVNALASSRQPTLALVSVRTRTFSGRPASQASWRCARCSEGLPMLNVRNDRPLAAMSAPVGVHREDTVDDYSCDVAGGAVCCVDAADRPAKGSKPGGGVLGESGFGGRAGWPALETAVGAPPGGQEPGEGCRSGI